MSTMFELVLYGYLDRIEDIMANLDNSPSLFFPPLPQQVNVLCQLMIFVCISSEQYRKVKKAFQENEERIEFCVR